MDIVSQYPSWYFILCFLLGLVYAYFLYRKDKKLEEFSKALIFGLAALRFLLVSFLSALLLAPLIKYQQREVVEPIIVIAEDRSSSMVNSNNSTSDKLEYLSSLNQLVDVIEEAYDVNHYYFGEAFRKKDSSINYSDRFTSYDEVWSGIEDRYANKNLGAIIFLSDGIYNSGSNPIYNGLSQKYPIYSIALGDTLQRKDLKLDRLIHNEIAFLDNQFPLKVDVSQLKLKGETSKLIIRKDGKTVYTEKLDFKENTEALTKEVYLTASKIGLQRYEVLLEQVSGESNLQNNAKSFYIDVLDGRQKILILYGSPHPDIKAIKSAIEENQNYEISLSHVEDWTGDVEEFDLLIAYQVPNKSSTNNDVILKAKAAKKPIWNIVGTATNSKFIDQNTWPIKAFNQRSQTNEVQGVIESSFPYFSLSDDLLNNSKEWPPLDVPLANYAINPNAYPLFLQKIGSVVTKMPLMAFSEKESQKLAILYGEGIWKWKLEDFRKNKNFKVFNEFINKTVQYLSLKSDQSLFRVSHEKEIFENEKLLFNAQLYNESYELVNDVDVEISIYNSKEEEFNYIFNKSQNAYNLRVSGLKPDQYKYIAKVSYANQVLTEKGEFSVKELQLETVDLVAKHNLLFQLSQKSGGKFYQAAEMSQIAEDLKAREDLKSIAYSKQEVEDIINMKGIFFVLLALLSLEWFLRKRNGAY